MQKKITVTGTNGTMEGSIEITMNYTTETYEYNNPSTHDTETNTRHTHKVEAFAHGSLFKTSDPLHTEQQVEKSARNLESLLGNHLKELVNKTPKETFAQRMKKLGYN